MSTPYEKALSLIDDAHSKDPTLSSSSDPSHPAIPSELYYAQRMTSFLTLHTPDASPILHLACRAQHLRRWEIPRSSYPATRPGYLNWRSFLKTRQASIAKDLCIEAGYSEDDAETVAGLVRKEGLGRKGGEGEVQILEDVACLVFLADVFEGFEKGVEEGKMVGVLRKTWGKMGSRGKELVGTIEMSDECKTLIQKALSD